MQGAPTHEVLNQPPPLEDFNAWTNDEALRDAVKTYGGGWAAP